MCRFILFRYFLKCIYIFSTDVKFQSLSYAYNIIIIHRKSFWGRCFKICLKHIRPSTMIKIITTISSKFPFWWDENTLGKFERKVLHIQYSTLFCSYLDFLFKFMRIWKFLYFSWCIFTISNSFATNHTKNFIQIKET